MVRRTQQSRSIRARRRGAVLFWLVLSLGFIIGIVALTSDGGRLMDQRRKVQAAVDAAALAAGLQLYEDYGKNQGLDPKGSARTAALAAAKANGFDDGVNCKVAVAVPPTSGAFAGKGGFVEVEIEASVAAGFSSGISGKALTVKQRAVAVGRPARMGIIALRDSGADALLVGTKVGVAVMNNDIIVNSDDSSAFHVNGKGFIQARKIDVVGDWVNSSGGTVLAKVRTGTQATADPLRFLQPPDSAGMVVRSGQQLKIDSVLPTILQPGIYQGGISISGQSVVTMMPGTYRIEGGGFSVSGQASVVGVEVMIHNTGGTGAAGPVAIAGKGIVTLAAPLSGPYRGIGIMQDRGVAEPVALSGNGAAVITGVIYAPSAPIAVTGNGGLNIDILGGSIIGDSVTVQGNGTIHIDLAGNFPHASEITLVE